jgi:hypothetical protein
MNKMLLKIFYINLFFQIYLCGADISSNTIGSELPHNGFSPPISSIFFSSVEVLEDQKTVWSVLVKKADSGYTSLKTLHADAYNFIHVLGVLGIIKFFLNPCIFKIYDSLCTAEDPGYTLETCSFTSYVLYLENLQLFTYSLLMIN